MKMKCKSILFAAIMLLFCISLPVGLTHTSIYASGSKSSDEVNGVVSSVAGTTISILNNNVDIDASTAKISLEDCNASVSVSDIAVGDVIETRGKVINGSFVARKIKIQGAAKLEGVVQAVGTNTITILGQVIDTTNAYCIKKPPTVNKDAQVHVKDTGSGLEAIVVNAQ